MAFLAPTQLEAAILRLKQKRKKLKKPVAPKAPVALERDYVRKLMPYLEDIKRHVEMRLIPRLPAIAAEFDSYRNRKRDAAPDDIAEIMAQIGLQIDEDWSREEISRIAQAKGLEVNAYNRRVIQNNIKKVVGIDVFFADPGVANELAMFTVNNAALIESISDDTLRKIETMTYQGLSDGMRVEELSSNILAQVDPEDGITRSRANLIARDQVSKLNGNLTQMRQTDLGIKRYIWRTVGDERVRESHARKEGQIYSWDDPPADTGHPGEDFQCRCYAEPVLEDLASGSDDNEE